jgi:uncharacterized protein
VRAVLDPNVLVSAAISPAGPPRQILTAWTERRFDLIASPTLLEELTDVLARPKFRRYISAALVAELIEGFSQDAVILNDPPEPPGISPDPDDDYLIALAQAAGADYIVSGDRDLLDLTDPQPPVLTPRQFLDVLDT